MEREWSRIEDIIARNNLTINSFANLIGVNSENLYRIRNAENGMSRRIADKICEAYPDLNRSWLLTGEGRMYVGHTNPIPFYKIDSTELFAKGERPEPSDYLSIPSFEGVDVAVLNSSPAMEPAIGVGDIVLLRHTVVDRIVYGGVYLIVGGGMSLIRRVRRSQNNHSLLLTAQCDSQFDPFEMEMSLIEHVCLVVGAFRQFKY